MADDVVLQTFPLGPQWPTIDPFLFCAHHDDAYPAGNGELGPAASLEGREIGADFAGVDGWRMYHGDTVPGFPGHPHRGFETVTFVRRGLIDHSDSLGTTARFGRGDTQWLTAGRGIVHSEMFPLVDPDAPNPLELFQIWLNLPAADKMVDPYFTMLWETDTPRVVAKDADGRVTEITVIAGEVDGQRAPLPRRTRGRPAPRPTSRSGTCASSPARSGSCRPRPGPRPSAPSTCTKARVTVGERRGRPRPPARCCAPTSRCRSRAGDAGAEVLMLQGVPIGEPVAQHGPFVMNDQAGIIQAFEDYQRTGFGGWPFDRDDPVHPREQGRFARHADGQVETVTTP